MLNCVKDIEKSREVKRTSKRIITYSFNLSKNEYYCPMCMKIYKGQIPDWCSSCGGHWTNFLTDINNPIEIEEELQED